MKWESRSWPQPVFHAMMLLVLISLSLLSRPWNCTTGTIFFTRFCGGTCRSFLRTSQFFCWWNTTFCWRNWRSCHPSLQQAFPAWLLLQLRLSTCQLGLFFIDAFSLRGYGKEITGSDSTEKTWDGIGWDCCGTQKELFWNSHQTSARWTRVSL